MSTPLGAPGGAGGVVDVRQALRPHAALRPLARARAASASAIRSIHSVSGRDSGSPSASHDCDSSSRAPLSSSVYARRSAGWVGSSGTYAAPAFMIAEEAPPSAPALRSMHSATRSSGPTPSARRWCASRLARRVQLRVRQRRRLRRPRPRRPACGPPAARRARGCTASAGYAASVRFHSSTTRARSRSGQEREPVHAPVLVRHHLLQHPPQVVHVALHRGPVEERRGVRQSAHDAVRPPRAARATGRTWPVACAVDRTPPTARPGSSSRAPRRVLPREQHLEERVVRDAARGVHPLHHLLEGDVLVVLRLQRPLLHPPQQLRHRRRVRTGPRAAPACSRRSR